MLWVTSIDRMVTNTSRPMTTGRQGLMNVSSPTNARSPMASVAHGSRRPPPPTRTSRPKCPLAPMKARRHCTSSRGPKLVSAPTAKISSHWTKPSSPISTPSSRMILGAMTIVRSPSRTPSPIDAPCTAVRVAALVRGERPEGVRVGAQRLEEAPRRAALRSSGSSSTRGQAHALERDAREEPGVAAATSSAARAATSRSTSSAVMKPSFSIDARSMPCSSASSTARRVAFGGPGRLGRRRLRGLRARSAAASSASLSATSAMRLPSSTSSPCA